MNGLGLASDLVVMGSLHGGSGVTSSGRSGSRVSVYHSPHLTGEVWVLVHRTGKGG